MPHAHPQVDATLRPATTSDVAAIRRCSRAAYATFAKRIGYEPKPMVACYARLVEAGGVWVLERGGAIIGVLVLTPEPEHLLLYSIAVHPDHQGGGHGRSMMRFVEGEARRRGYDVVVLYTNEMIVENIRFYEGIGYERFDRRRHATRGDSWVVFMRKTVTPRRMDDV